jgi:hypothetical protein
VSPSPEDEVVQSKGGPDRDDCYAIVPDRALASSLILGAVRVRQEEVKLPSPAGERPGSQDHEESQDDDKRNEKHRRSHAQNHFRWILIEASNASLPAASIAEQRPGMMWLRGPGALVLDQ